MADSEGLNAYLKTNNSIWYGILSLHPDLLISINDQLNCLYKLVAPWNNIYVIFFSVNLYTEYLIFVNMYLRIQK